MEEAQFKDFRQGMRRTLVVASMWEGVEKKKKKKIWRWKKQIFERKITVTAAQSRDVEKTE